MKNKIMNTLNYTKEMYGYDCGVIIDDDIFSTKELTQKEKDEIYKNDSKMVLHTDNDYVFVLSIKDDAHNILLNLNNEIKKIKKGF